MSTVGIVKEVEESRGNDLHVFGNGRTPVG